MDYFDLTGKTALITGASSGLGERFSQILSKAGARVILASRRIDQLKRNASNLKNALVVEMDVANKNSVHMALTQLEQQNEKIDICINSAGIAKINHIFDKDENDNFRNIMQTNVMGTWYVIQTIAQHMKKKTYKRVNN